MIEGIPPFDFYSVCQDKYPVKETVAGLMGMNEETPEFP